MAPQTPKYDRPVDIVRTQADAVRHWRRNPTRVVLTVANGQPRMPPPWQPRMQLDGAVLYAHPVNERHAVNWLNGYSNGRWYPSRA